MSRSSIERHPNRARRRPLIDLLERRLLMTTLTVNGTAADDIMILSARFGTITVTVNASILRFDDAMYDDVALNALGGADVIEIDLTGANPVTVAGGAGDDQLKISPGAANLSLFEAPVTFDGGVGTFDAIDLFDAARPSGLPSYGVNLDTVTATAFPGLTYAGAEVIRLRTANNGSAVFVNATAPQTTLLLDGGLGIDDVQVALGSGNLGLVGGGVSFISDANAFDAVELHDEQSTGKVDYVIDAASVTRTGGFGGLFHPEDLDRELFAGSGDNEFRVGATALGADLVMHAGAGDDVLRIGTGDLDETRSSTDFFGNAGHDEIFVDDGVEDMAEMYFLSAGFIDRSLFGGLTYGTSERLQLLCGPHNSAVDVMGTAPGTPVFVDTNLTSTGDGIFATSTAPDAPVTALASPGFRGVTIDPPLPTLRPHVILDGAFDLAGVTIIEAGKVSLASGSVVKTKSLTLDPGTTLDVNNGTFIVDYDPPTSPLPAIRSALASGYNGGGWNGSGITSTAAASVPGTAVGFAEAADLFATFPASFAGQTVDATAVLLRHARYGDTNLDRAVNLQDFNRLAANFGQANRRWSQGDFNFDQAVNLIDFNRLAANFGLTLAAPTIGADDRDDDRDRAQEEPGPHAAPAERRDA